MGFISRKILPACGNMCVCCPALRPSSRRPVKRYKKLLAEIFPKTLDGPPNERKIMKLCEYAAKNPARMPKIAKFLEQRSYKELRAEHINSIKIITETYNKLLSVCKGQMACFASSLLNVIAQLLDHKQQETTQILGCQILTMFIYSQADSTYARKIEDVSHTVCKLACEDGGKQKKLLRAASLQCLSAMVWFMKEYSDIFENFDKIVHATLQNYGNDERVEDGNERSEQHHNWVDEVVRCEARAGSNIGESASASTANTMPHPATKDSSTLTREERETPEVWSQICIQKMAELAMESTTMRRVLDPMFAYFDAGRHWSTRHGLALHVLSDMSYLLKSSGNEQMILTATIRHLDHKNVVHDSQIKSNIVKVATFLAQQLRTRAVAAEIGVASDLCKHLRRSLQATIESVCLQEANWDILLQNSIEDCLVEIAKAIGDAHPLYDMMTMTLEKLPVTAVVARATIQSMLVLAHIISTVSVNSHPQMVFPEALLVQVIKAMMHPDVETRIGAHQIFSAILVRSPTYARNEYQHRKWQIKPTSAFASATALFEKLRREKEPSNTDKRGNCASDDASTKNKGEEGAKSGRAQKTSPYFHKLSSSIVDRTAASPIASEAETNIMILNEDQIAQLLSSFWLEAHQSDNLPSNFEAIAHSFSLTLLSSRLKNSSQSNTVHFFQLPLSLMTVSFNSKGSLPPSCQRSLLTLASGMLAFAGKIYHMNELTDALKIWISSSVDPYLRIGDDFQLYISPQSELKYFGTDADQQAAISLLTDLRKVMAGSVQELLNVIIRNLLEITNLRKDELAKQLSETFTPDVGPLSGSIPLLDWERLQTLANAEESLSLDEECSRTSSVDGETISGSPATIALPRFISRVPSKPPLPPVISVGQLLESALHVAGNVAGTPVSTSPLPYSTMASQCEARGLGTRMKLSTWLVNSHDSVPDDTPPTFSTHIKLGIVKEVENGTEKKSQAVAEQWQALRLPPASPFDNFMRAAGC